MIEISGWLNIALYECAEIINIDNKNSIKFWIEVILKKKNGKNIIQKIMIIDLIISGKTGEKVIKIGIETPNIKDWAKIIGFILITMTNIF